MILIGHRGAAGLAPENTLASIQKALEYRVDMLEIDIRATKDGHLVLHHNEALGDAAGNNLHIRDYTFAELQTHKPDLALLDEAIAAVGRKVPLIIEIKPGEPVQPLIQHIRQARAKGWQPNDIWVASFHFAALQEVHAALPDVPLIVNEQWSGVRGSLRCRRLQTRHIAMNARWLWRGFIRGVGRSGYHLLAYNLNDPRKARRWERAGLAGIYTDYPDRFRSAKS